jgi:MinD superfamily P-loop ATPase
MEIEKFLKEENIVHIANLPYDEAFTKAMTNGKTIVEYADNNLSKIISESWNKIKENIN